MSLVMDSVSDSIGLFSASSKHLGPAGGNPLKVLFFVGTPLPSKHPIDRSLIASHIRLPRNG